MSPSDKNLTDARAIGLDPDRLRQLVNVVEKDTAKGSYHGAVIALGRGGKIALHHAVGKTDPTTDRQAHIDDVFITMSLAKAMMAVLVLKFVESGKLMLTTPVAEIIPEFGIRGKGRVTVANLLTQTAGLPSEPPMIPLESFSNLQAYTAAVCAMKLEARPGSAVSYSPLNTHAVLGEMVRRLDGGQRPLRQILAEELFQPLGMSNTAMGVPPSLAKRLVPVAFAKQKKGLFEPMLLEAMNVLLTEEAEVPGGGTVSTAMDIFRLAEMLRQGGQLDGKRILSQSTIEYAVKNHTGDYPNELFDYAREMYDWPDFPAYLGLSFFLRGEGVFPTPFGITTSPRTFGGLGAGSTIFWVDPERDLTFVCLTAGLLEEGESFHRFQRLSDLAVSTVVD